MDRRGCVRARCPWTVSTAAWAVLKSPAAGAGSFTLALEIERNTGPGRVVTITVGSAEFLLRQLGVREIRPVHGDFSGDGAADLALFRPSTGGWWIPRLFVTTVGGLFQLPVPGDYDGDAVTDPATYELKNGIWRFADGSTVTWGRVGDIPVPADYNGDGRTDIAVFRPSTGRWFILNAETFDWGLPADIPIAADFDGDGRADPAVFRRSTGTWWIRGIGAWMWGRAATFLWRQITMATAAPTSRCFARERGNGLFVISSPSSTVVAVICRCRWIMTATDAQTLRSIVARGICGSSMATAPESRGDSRAICPRRSRRRNG